MPDPGLRIDADEATLSEVLDALGDSVDSLSWALADAELFLDGEAPIVLVRLADRAAAEVVWLDGDRLRALASRIATANWGALLGFDTRLDTLEPTPWSQGHPPSIQHPSARVEVQCVDGGAFEVFARQPALLDRVAARFPSARSVPPGPAD